MVHAGIDIGKYVLVAAIDGEDIVLEIANDTAGRKELARWLTEAQVTCVGMEASGGYERDVRDCLRAAGFEVRLLHAASVRAFAKLKRIKAKTDRIDARIIARFTAEEAAPAREDDPRIEALREEMRFLEQIEADRARWKTRREHYRTPTLVRRIDTRIRHLTKERDLRRKRLLEALRRHDDLATRLDLLLSIDGIGERTAMALLIYMPELGTITREEAAALAGLAPFNADSGTMKGQRRIRGGRTELRRTLCNAASAAARWWNDDLKTFYDRLRDKGKHHTCALVACARKLLVTANAVIRKATKWKPTQTTG